MLSGKERKKLYQEVEDYRKKVVEARRNLNLADKQKEEWFGRKESISKDISDTINKIKSMRVERNKLTNKVKELKGEREKYGKFIKNKVEEFKRLAKERSQISKKYKIKTNPARIKEEILKLEEKLETEALEFDKEKKIVGVIKSKKKQLDESSELMGVLEKTRNLSKEIDVLKERADKSHNRIQNLAKSSQEIHLQIIGFSKQVDELKKKKEWAYMKFFEFKKRFSNLNVMLKENLMKMNIFSRKTKEERYERREKIEKKKERFIDKKQKEVKDKLKKGKKLTTEDILIMQHGEVDEDKE
jgi:phosphoserine phosphatase